MKKIRFASLLSLIMLITLLSQSVVFGAHTPTNVNNPEIDMKIFNIQVRDNALYIEVLLVNTSRYTLQFNGNLKMTATNSSDMELIDSIEAQATLNKLIMQPGGYEYKTFKFLEYNKNISVDNADFKVNYELSYKRTKTNNLNEEMKIYLNGSLFTFDVKPELAYNSTMVPLRGILEAMDAKVSWDDAKKEAVILRNGQKIQILSGTHIAYVDGVYTALIAKSYIKNGRVFVPLRFISETFGANVFYGETEKMVIIVY